MNIPQERAGFHRLELIANPHLMVNFFLECCFFVDKAHHLPHSTWV